MALSVLRLVRQNPFVHNWVMKDLLFRYLLWHLNYITFFKKFSLNITDTSNTVCQNGVRNTMCCISIILYIFTVEASQTNTFHQNLFTPPDLLYVPSQDLETPKEWFISQSHSCSFRIPRADDSWLCLPASFPAGRITQSC